MISTAIVKPDHLGDFVLAVPAIRAILAEFGSADIYCSFGSAFLKRHFFPTAAERAITLAYLSKQDDGISTDSLVEQLSGYDLVFVLRGDDVMHSVAERLRSFVVISDHDDSIHETLLHKRAIEPIVGRYSRSALFEQQDRLWPGKRSTFGLCVSAGFFSNKWPLAYWRELALMLLARGAAQIVLIGGKAERIDLGMLFSGIPSDKKRMVVGDTDVSQFLADVSTCDVVIGTDSGTLHICSSVVPTLGIFTSSPWRRYAPFGRRNRVITLDLDCSPCVQFSRNTLNACLSRECGALLNPKVVVDALELSGGQPQVRNVGWTKVIDGVSHLGNA